MRRLKYILPALLFTINNYSQDYQFTPVTTNEITSPNILPPDVSSFQKVNFLPVSNYTGRANINIPFYEIDLGGLKIPIGLSYNTGGVKMNDVASSAGLNWSLNAGGIISKTVRGIDDFTRGFAQYYNWESHITYFYGAMGWLSYYTRNPAPYQTEIVEESIDSQPDIFNASAPGMNFSFVHNRATVLNQLSGQLIPFGKNYLIARNQNGQDINITDQGPNDAKPFILEQDNSYKIEEFYGNTQVGMWGVEEGMVAPLTMQYWTDNGIFNAQYAIYGINSIVITSKEGFRYIFDKIDASQYVYDRNPQHLASEYYTKSTNINIVSYHLSKIIDLTTNRSVEFQYETYIQSFSEIMDNNSVYTGYLADGTAIANPNYSAGGMWQRYPNLNRIKKIIFDKGSINFNYALNRDDLPGGKALTDITLLDMNNNQIKKATLNFEYFQSATSPASPFSKRLKLKDINFQGTNNTLNEKYRFTYNNTSLPLRAIPVTDLFGYHNGQANNFTFNFVANPPGCTVTPIPISYFHVNNGQNTFLPMPLSSSAFYIHGNYSALPNLNYCKAGILEQIDYPTGGYIKLDYELNRYMVNTTEMEGGGLRIKEQKISDGNTVRNLKFEYKDENNRSSGSVASLPKVVDFYYNGPTQTLLSANITEQQFKAWFEITRKNFSKSNIELTSGCYVGYSRVKIFEENKGYSIYNYSAPSTYPNTLPDIASFLNDQKMKIYYDNGKTDLIFDNDVFRGKLLNESVFDQQNNRIREKTFEYTENLYKSMLMLKIIDEYCVTGSSYTCFPQQYGYVKQRRYSLRSEIEKEYFNGVAVTKSKIFDYDDNYSVIKRIYSTEDYGRYIDNYRDEYYYSFDSETQGDFGIPTLIQNNRKSEKILSYHFKNNIKLFEDHLIYGSFTRGLILPKKAKKYKLSSTSTNSNTPEMNSLEVTLRDEVGNICEYTDLANNKNTYIWGYNRTEIIAKIENIGYTSINNNLIIVAQETSDTGSEADLIIALNNLRSNLVGNMVTTYTYIPLIGISSITDPKGDKISYSYDALGRLQNIKDKEGNVLSETEYHYKQ